MSTPYSCIIFPDREVALTRRLRANLAGFETPPGEVVEIPRPGIFPEREALRWALPQITRPFTVLLDSDMLLDPDATTRIIEYFQDPKLGCVAGILRDECVGTFGYVKMWRTSVLRDITTAPESIRSVTPDTEYAGRCEEMGWKFERLPFAVGNHAPRLDPFTVFNIHFRVGMKQRARGRIGTRAQLWGVEGALKVGTPWAHLALFAFHCGIQVDYDGDPHDRAWYEFSYRYFLKVRPFCEALVRETPAMSSHASERPKIKVMLTSCCLMTGGVERVMVNMARHLNPDRFEVIAAYESGSDKELLMDLDRAKRRYLEVGAGWDAALQTEKPDVVVSFLKTGVHEAASRLGIPMIERTPGWNGHSNLTKDRFERVVVEYQKFGRELLSKPECLATEDRVEVLYNGVDLSQYAPRMAGLARKACGIREDAFVMGTLARITPVKNLGMQIRVLRRVVDMGKDAELHILGRESDSEERARLEVQARNSGLQGLVFFHGVVRDPSTHLAAFDVVTLSSRTEGAPNALIEAMAMERPIVATDVGGVKEITDDMAFYTAVDDDEAFARGVVEMAARGSVKYPGLARHDLSKCMSRWEEILEEVYLSHQLA